MATLPLKSSHKEQHSVIRLLWAKGLSANTIQSEMRPVCYKCFTKSLLMAEKVLLVRKKFEEPGRRVVSTTMQRSQQSILSYSLTGVWRDK